MPETRGSRITIRVEDSRFKRVSFARFLVEETGASPKEALNLLEDLVRLGAIQVRLLSDSSAEAAALLLTLSARCQ